MKPRESVANPREKVEMIAPGAIYNGLVLSSIETTPVPSSVQLDRNDLNDVDSRLTSYRELLNNNRGRGTSLERTEKEKRVQDSPKGIHSTNPGDTALSPLPVTPNLTALDSISSNQPTEGVRAQYRLWRDSHHGRAPEKAWSIGDVGADDMLGGQVEKSIKDAMAGIEPNNRSRKASHSLRFFKEGLPDDTTKKRGKSQGRSKEGSTRPKQSPLSESLKQRPFNDPSDRGLDHQNSNRFREGQSPVSPPHERGGPTSKLQSRQSGYDLTSDSTTDAPTNEGYFDLPRKNGVLSQDEVQTLPLALLAEIRNNHNLTPGASKGSSFSRSIPVTESERSRSDSNDLDSKPVEIDLRIDGDTFDEEHHTPPKSADDEDESGEEQISSALFVPHKTPHESQKQDLEGLQRATGPKSSDHSRTQVSTSQEWLEEYQVPTRDVDQNGISQEHTSHPTASPPRATQSSSYFEENSIFPESPAVSDIPQSPASESGYTTVGDESSVTDDQEITPTGSLKHDISKEYSQQLHYHQQVPRQPLEAIELIPYRHQVGGHTTMWRFSKRAVCKQLNNRENEFYEKIERYHPQLLKFLPRYIGVLNVTLEKQVRRKTTRKDLVDTTGERPEVVHGGETGLSTQVPVEPSTFENDYSAERQAEKGRVISQSLQSTSVPIPTVSFADNRHIIPKSFMQPHPHLMDLQQRSKSDSAQPSKIPNGSAQMRSSVLHGNVKYRPTLSDKHAVSWGATTVNKQLRNQVFNEAFLNQPIPIYPHKKPASQNRSLPSRSGISHLRNSNSESSLKAAQQSQQNSSSQPAEQSIRRQAIQAAAERRNGLTPLTSIEFGPNINEGDATDQDAERKFSEKAGTSAPERDTSPSLKGKRQRRYSSGGLRRKPAEVQDDRGNLKYFEEADDVGYKGDAEEDVFHMHPEPTMKKASSSMAQRQLRGHLHEVTDDEESVAGSEISKASSQGTIVSTDPVEPSQLLDFPRPINPKEAQTQRDSRVEYFLLLEDLTTGMKRPCIMDLKMGTRQYGVQANDKKRISQRRKCADTTSKQLGVRVCGLQVWDIKRQEYIFLDKYFGRDLQVGRPFQDALKRFLYDGVDYSSVLRHIPTILKKLSQLELLIQSLAGYRFYAASLLLFYDGDTQGNHESDSVATGVDWGKKNEIDFKIADFANCVTKEDVRLNEQPAPPQHPDLPDNGFLRGLRSLRKYFVAIQHECQAEMGGTRQDFIDVTEGAIDEDIVSY